MALRGILTELVIAAAVVTGTPIGLGADLGRVAVVYTGGIDAYGEALEGLRSAIPPSRYSVEAVDTKIHSSDLPALLRPPTKVVVAIGADAIAAIAFAQSVLPLVTTMVLGADSAANSPAEGARPRVVGSVILDVPVLSLLQEIKNVYPGKVRLGVIHNLNRSGFDPDFAAKGKLLGFAVQIVELKSTNQLIPVFLSLRGKVDLVICLPDSTLFNSATIEPFILASLENKLPVVGFSSAFTRAGAAIGIFPDYREVGAQTAEVVLQYLTDQRAQGEGYPRRMRVTINDRVARLLGLHFNEPVNAARLK